MPLSIFDARLRRRSAGLHFLSLVGSEILEAKLHSTYELIKRFISFRFLIGFIQHK